MEREEKQASAKKPRLQAVAVGSVVDGLAYERGLCE
jgi:hypothetical protein